MIEARPKIDADLVRDARALQAMDDRQVSTFAYSRQNDLRRLAGLFLTLVAFVERFEPSSAEGPSSGAP